MQDSLWNLDVWVGKIVMHVQLRHNLKMREVRLQNLNLIWRIVFNSLKEAIIIFSLKTNPSEYQSMPQMSFALSL